MANIKILTVCFGLLIVASMSTAGCAASAYQQACAQCTFDANGKMDKACYDSKISSATTCYMTKEPEISAKYFAGQCKNIDRCINIMKSCQATKTTGNDRLDCQQGTVSSCFVNADACFNKQIRSCEDEQLPIQLCPTSFMFLGICVGFVYLQKK